jgi:hypothetical protein
MLPGSTEAEAVLVAQRLQTAMSNAELPIRGKRVMLRARSGVAQLQAKESASDLMARAAKRLEDAPQPVAAQ